MARLMDKTGLYSEARDHLAECIRIRRMLPNSNEQDIANSLFGKGVVLLHAGANDAGLMYFTDALVSLKSLPDEGGMATADTLNMMGLLSFEAGDDDGALILLEESLAISESRKEWSRVATACNIKGQVHFKRKEYEETASCYQQCLSCHMTLKKDDVILVNDYVNIGIAQSLACKVKVASYRLEEDLQLSYNDYGECHKKTGLVHREAALVAFINRDVAKGQSHLEKFSEKCRHNDNELIFAHALVKCGNVNFDVGSKTAAKKCWSDALSLYMLLKNDRSESSIVVDLEALQKSSEEGKQPPDTNDRFRLWTVDERMEQVF
mmetsp:Transcript_34478/g.50470  ORF Transcript_34478/g.50470 Transcript_34478/m.50470 type:complete len:322 (+) Transcript_34478:446-1411(+)